MSRSKWLTPTDVTRVTSFVKSSSVQATQPKNENILGWNWNMYNYFCSGPIINKNFRSRVLMYSFSMSTFGWNLLPSKYRSVNSGHGARAFKRLKVSWPWGDKNKLISTDTKFIFLSKTNRLLNCIPNKERCSTDISWRSFLFEVYK